MGRRLVALTTEDPELRVAAAVDRVEVGQDAGLLAGVRKLDVPVTDSLRQKVDAVIDFTVPAGTRLPAISTSCFACRVMIHAGG